MLVDLVLIHQVHVVDALDVGVVAAVIVVDGDGGMQRTLQRIHGVAVVGVSRQGFLLGQREEGVHGQVELLEFVVEVHVSAVALESRVAGHVLLVGVVHATGKAGVAVAAHHREVVVLLQGFAEERTLPVGIAVLGPWRIAVDHLFGMLLCPLDGLARVEVGIGQTFQYQFAALVATHGRTEPIGKVRNTETGFGRIGGLAGLSLLGSDEHHTVGTACTIKRCRGGIFQDGHVLNVGGVEGVQDAQSAGVHVVRGHVARHHGHAVEHKQGLVAGTDRAQSAHGDRRVGTGSTRHVLNVHTREVTFHHLRERDHGQVLLFVGAHHRCRTGIARLAHITITGDHHLVEFGVAAHDDIALQGAGACTNANHLVAHAHIREAHAAGRGRSLNAVAAVGIGHGGNLVAVQADAHAGQGLAGLIAHITRDGALAAGAFHGQQGHHVAVHPIVAVDLLHGTVEHVAHRLVGLVDGDVGQRPDFIRVVDEAYACLFLYFVKQFVNRH